MTTIFYPDVSNWDLGRGLSIAPSTVAVCCRSTFGVNFVDAAYLTYKRQASNRGAFFFAYHWLNHGNAAGQASYFMDQCGDVPVMIDAEDTPGNTGYNGTLTVTDIVTFANKVNSLGGKCHLAYLPKWYWQNMGSPSLKSLQDVGLNIVSSNYTTYSDGGPGWAPYYQGAPAPMVWQYTSSQPYGGARICDFNAYKSSATTVTGALSAFIAMLLGGDMATADEIVNAFLARKLTLHGNTTPQQVSIQTILQNLGNLRDAVLMTEDEANANSLHISPDSQLGSVFGVAKNYPPASSPLADQDRALLNEILTGLSSIQTGGQPTQDQVDAAVAKAFANPDVTNAIADRLATHFSVQ